ncbi:MAG: hypothetical protein GY863_20030 [bacterium]|nr:hypothetical protein [bacterium]
MNLYSALEAAERAVELDESGLNLDTKAVVLMKLGRYEDAIKTVERIIEIKGKQKRYIKRLAEIKAEMEKKSKK